MQKKGFLFIALILAINVSIFGQETSSDKVWKEVNTSELPRKSDDLYASPSVFKTFRVNQKALRGIINDAPLEFSEAARNEEVILTLPMPDGTFARFRIENSSIMEPELAAKFPEINSYRGQGIDAPSATVRFDVSPNGFRAMILSNDGTIFIEPYDKSDTINYISFEKADLPKDSEDFVCLTGGDSISELETFNFTPETFFVSNGATLKTYRLAVAATGEYTAFHGGTVAGAIAAINTTMNRVNGIYERDLSVRMVLIANNDLIVYTNGATDPYTDSNASSMLNENQTNLTTTIGTLNYDIGHVFSTGGGGTASLRSPCSADSKARGVTGTGSPMNDAFDVDYVAHEMGHQFGANHTFNGTVSSCSGNRSNGTAYEPGSGITIMAYAGICGSQNLARKGIDTFHVRSLEEIVAFITNGATGGSCSANIATSNTAPTVSVSAAGPFNIPKQTPFALDADATDPNGDSITYDWQEYNLGAEAATVPNTDADGAVRPIFRSYVPQTSGRRFFPSLKYILNNANMPPSTYACSVFTCLTGELLPAITRPMNFQVIARDNHSGGGGISTATVQILVDGDSGPFNVTSPNANTNFTGGSSQIVTWSVNNTNIAPVNAANVKISLSTDGGQTFPIVLAAATPNDGSQSVTLPNITTSTARLKIEALGNVFFDISDANFAVTLQPTAANVSVSGRVVTAQNRGIRNVLVTMTDVNGVQRTATTNSNGYFRFSGVETGGNYSFRARSKNYSFTESAQVHNITEETDDIKFVSVGRR